MLGDKTGPRGQGPKTGRQAGYCAGYDHPGYLDPNISEDRRGGGLGVRRRRPVRGTARNVNLGRRASDSFASRPLWSDGPPD